MSSKMYTTTRLFTPELAICQVAWSLPVCQMVSYRHFFEGFMTLFFDRHILQDIQSSPKTFDKLSVVILLQQSQTIFVQTQNSAISHKNIDYVFLPQIVPFFARWKFNTFQVPNNFDHSLYHWSVLVCDNTQQVLYNGKSTGFGITACSYCTTTNH